MQVYSKKLNVVNRLMETYFYGRLDLNLCNRQPNVLYTPHLDLILFFQSLIYFQIIRRHIYCRHLTQNLLNFQINSFALISHYSINHLRSFKIFIRITSTITLAIQ